MDSYIILHSQVLNYYISVSHSEVPGGLSWKRNRRSGIRSNHRVRAGRNRSYHLGVRRIYVLRQEEPQPHTLPLNPASTPDDPEQHEPLPIRTSSKWWRSRLQELPSFEYHVCSVFHTVYSYEWYTYHSYLWKPNVTTVNLWIDSNMWDIGTDLLKFWFSDDGVCSLENSCFLGCKFHGTSSVFWIRPHKNS